MVKGLRVKIFQKDYLETYSTPPYSILYNSLLPAGRPFSTHFCCSNLEERWTGFLVCCKLRFKIFLIIKLNHEGALAVALNTQLIVCFIIENCSKEAIVLFSQPILDFLYFISCAFRNKRRHLRVEGTSLIHIEGKHLDNVKI